MTADLDELIIELDGTLDDILLADPPVDDLGVDYDDQGDVVLTEHGLHLQRCYGELCKLYARFAERKVPGATAICAILDTHLEPLANLDNWTFVNKLPEAALALDHELNLYKWAVAA